MNEIVAIPQKDGFGRELFYLFVPKFEDIPKNFELPSENFVLLFAGDLNLIEYKDILSWSHNLIDNGLVYFCAWGKDCQQAENAVDFACVEKGFDDSDEPKYFVMTNASSQDSLDEFLWFGLYLAYPDDEYTKDCKSNLLIVVENEDWNKQILSKISNVESFNKMVIEKTDNEQLTNNN